MAEPAHEVNFLAKGLAIARHRGQVLVQDLDDNQSPGVALPGQVNPAHAARAERSDDFIPVQEETDFHGDWFAAQSRNSSAQDIKL